MAAPGFGVGGGWLEGRPVSSPFGSRPMSAATASIGARPSCTTAATCSMIGTSTPWSFASCSTESQDLTPSAVWRVTATTSATLIPRPRFTPKVRLRESGDMHVATRSPSPARPAKVAGSPPRATPRRVVSARPRVMIEALELSPMPMPSAMPTARATTFLTAPPSSVPMTSVFV
jgi:hypothetical protein